MRTQFPKTNALNQIAKLLGNSFYGRFGMHPLFNPTKVLNKSNFYKLIHSGDISLLKDFISLNDEFFITTNSANEDKVILGDSIIKTDVSIGIAAAVTAYSRIIMAQFKNLAAESGVNLYYSDTDSVVTNLGPEAMAEAFGVVIGDKIGQLKLECTIEKAVFLAPKAYYLELDNGEKVIKIKGLNQNNLTQENKNKLNLNNFVSLLKKDAALDLEQEIWSKNREQGLVDIVQQAYQLKSSRIDTFVII
jgi:DNA polymerase elongation subunit (family B)